MSETVLALLGFATVIAVIVLLLRNVTVPCTGIRQCLDHHRQPFWWLTRCFHAG